MAKKKTIALRVHTLAKELGVSSKDIVAKCVAEDIPDITNHMSAVSVGLSHTVREWFGNADGEASTAVETSAKVDVVKARAKVRKTTKKVVVEEPVEPTPVATEVMVAEPPIEVIASMSASAKIQVAPAPEAPAIDGDMPEDMPEDMPKAVSYTHLTLPTN